MTVADLDEAVRLAEEFRAERAVSAAAGAVGRARRYGWPQDKRAILEATLAAARARLTAIKTYGPGVETNGR